MSRFPGGDGLELAYRDLGHGRPLVLLHGFASTSAVWLDSGLAATLAEHGRRVILPDLRGHGDSASPHAAYPPDVLVDDGLALVEELGLDDYDLGGHSLGGRTALRMLVRGAHPARAVVIGQGLGSVIPRRRRPGGPAHPVLGTFVPTPESALSRIATRTLVVTGTEDTVDGPGLAAALPDARHVQVPGDHLTALDGPELAAALIAFLDEP
ncbi:alpha/beta fold hydrolase [Actinophytocola oryzae]|uniref:Alpha/beta hydrolase family protein n=1 Tax=Actinophytocola oryzae TaxID=502181 RepID=A0A4R7VL99_9PSEU|nr:alpha/beta fold hydrolase [Actinophytocola oryzae]TDV49979.1 alpha/beta hydrolase family protein [Actinophytocola oryzae]